MKFDPKKGWYYEYRNGYPVLSSPILKKYKNNRKTAMVNQLFEENLVPFYKISHGAWDFKTQGVFRYILHKIKGFTKSGRISEAKKGGIIPIQATHSGKVIFAGEDDGGGKYVKVLSNEVEINGKKAKIETLYYHLNSYRVRTDQRIKDGTIVGYAGNSGKYTTGAHLHFAVRIHWKSGMIYQPDYKNGYNGNVDPLPFMSDGTIYQRGTFVRRYFQFGKEVNKKDLIY